MKGDQVLLITPFTNTGDIDEKSLANHIEFVLGSGAHGVIGLGSTGEFFVMEPKERVEVMRSISQCVDGRVPVTFGVGDSSTRTAIELAKNAEELGANCVMLQAPYYFQHSTQAILTHFLMVARSISIPVMVYDGGGGTEISIEQLEYLNRQEANINCVKTIIPNPTKIGAAVSSLPDMRIFCGDEYTLMLALHHGAVGSSIGAGNIQPDVTSGIHNSFEEGNLEEARRLYNEKLLPATAIVATSKSEYIRCFKEVLAAKGIIKSPFTREPLLPLDPIRREELMSVMKDLGVL
ncbi:MAG: dihydrodipicolinate synthase family protein [Prochloron sp. SP5CPC1]|nr:dihydrodipicolinate synthase family protein [Candidatus Paraprochloron terpiosi SP5CPC1]